MVQEHSTLPKRRIIIGVTGSLGSGCSTITDHLEKKYEFVKIKVSDLIRKELENAGQSCSPDDLQDHGDHRRKERIEYWVEKAAHQFVDSANSIVLDGIRNPGEVNFLRRNFHYFFLISVDADRKKRHKRYRQKTSNKISDTDFKKIDDRDSGKHNLAYGQRVSDCIDLSDFQILNDDDWTHDNEIKDKFHKKTDAFIDLVLYPEERQYPSPIELGMHLAYSVSLRSRCLKRKVGAALVRQSSEHNEIPISLAYNDPVGKKSCQSQYGCCYRDKVRKEIQNKSDSIDILEILRGSGLKLLDICQSVHAEESAILQAARLGSVSVCGSTLYTTTFPCLLCAKKIVHTGIEKIVYNESYPTEESYRLLKEELSPENIVRFEGIKSVAFFKLFQHIF